MSRFIDMTGKRYNRLTVLEYVEKRGNKSFWKCRCDCGNETVVDGSKIRRGTTKSCGCLKAETIKRQRKHNKYQIINGYAKVEMDNGDYMVCDIEDWERLKNHHWYVNAAGYAVSETMKDGSFSFHKKVTNTTFEVVDHINRNKLDNRKENLRICDMSINSINRGLQSNNTSGYKGVGYDARYNTWFARVCVNNKIIHLGTYPTKEQAIQARIKGEEKYYKPKLEKAVQIC